MSDYERSNTSSRCLRNSPIASLVGFIIVLIGGGAFGGAIVFARRYMNALLDQNNSYPYLDYAVYGLVGALGLFSLLAYLLCALSSGSNAKRIFESSRKSACGRCCNMALIISLVIGIILWVVILCLVSYVVMSINWQIHRQNTLPRLLISSKNALGLRRYKRLSLSPDNMYNIQIEARKQPDLTDFITPGQQPNGLHEYTNDDRSWTYQTDTDMDQASLPDSTVLRTLQTEPPGLYDRKSVPMFKSLNAERVPEEIVVTTPSSFDSVIGSNRIQETVIKPLEESVESVVDGLKKAESLFYKCDPETIDLSYYGLYNAKGLPSHIPRKNFESKIQEVFICSCVSVAGIFLIILGYLQIIVCSSMNFARLQERRYYETSDVGEEGEPLDQ